MSVQQAYLAGRCVHCDFTYLHKTSCDHPSVLQHSSLACLQSLLWHIQAGVLWHTEEGKAMDDFLFGLLVCLSSDHHDNFQPGTQTPAQ